MDYEMNCTDSTCANTTNASDVPAMPSIGELAALVKELGPPPEPMYLYMDQATFDAHKDDLLNLPSVTACIVQDGLIAVGKYVALPVSLFAPSQTFHPDVEFRK